MRPVDISQTPQAKRIRKLRETIDPATGRVYTYERIGEIEGISHSYAQYLNKPEHHLRRQRRYRMVKSVEEKFSTIAREDWASAYALLNRLRAILKEASNVR